MIKCLIYFIALFLFPLQITATIYDLGTYLTSNKAAFQIKGAATGDGLGFTIANAGDFNGDGYDDIIIGAQGIVGATTASSTFGKAYVIYGKAGFSFTDVDINNLNPASSGFKITGKVAGDDFGNSVAGAGDINKDGLADIIIAASSASSMKGIVYVIYGNRNPTNIVLASTSLNPSTTGFTITGNVDEELGYVVAPAGDVNKDGYADMIIGSPIGNSNRGIAYVIYGRATANLANINLGTTALNPSTTGFTIKGAASGDYFGNSVSTAGDINGDGYADIIIGAMKKNTQRGTVYVIYGKLSPVNIDLSSTTLVPGTNGFTVAGKSSNELFGIVVNTAGDINNDGYADMLIGATVRNSYQGAVQVIYGGPNSGFSNIDLKQAGSALNPTSKGFVITGNGVGDNLGSAVAPAGDINNDGFGDIIVTAANKNSDKGAIYVIYGGSTLTRANINLATELNPLVNGFAITGTLSGGQFGFTADKIDLDKDGKSELLVGAPEAMSGIGVGYVIFPSKICSTNCASCSQVSTCDTCTSAYGVENSQCITCPSGKYPNNGGPCATCPTGCTQCTSATACTSCLTGYYKPVGTNVLCTVCPTGCTQCSSNSVCSSCSTGYYLPAGSNVLCAACATGCSQCSSNMACSSCLPGYYLSGYTCQSCPGGCSTCSAAGGGGPNAVCSVCLAGYISSGGKCCPDKCTTCTDYQTCTACQAAYGIISPGVCGTCPPKTVLVSGVCQGCPSDCSVCTSSSVCTTCDSGYGLYLSQCVSSCPDGTYLANGRCETCVIPCKTCSADASTCTSCFPGKIFHVSQCLDSCPDKTFPPFCDDCPVTCSACSSSTICTACEAGNALMSSQCAPCPDGTYLSSTGSSCDDCPGTCSKCSSSTVCTACEAGNALIASQCVPCPDGTYLEIDRCEVCALGCSKCTSDSVCQECINGYSLSISQLCEVNPQPQPPEKEESPVQTREKAVGNTFDGASIAGAALASGSSMPVNFGLVAKILRNLKYLNATVSIELQQTFYSWKVNAGFLRAPKSWSSESHSKPLPMVFQRYGLDPVFLINYWKPLIMTLIGLTIFIAFKVMEVGLKRGEALDKKSSIPRQLNVAASNFALTQIYSTLDDVFFYFVLDVRSTEFDGAFRIFSFVLALVLISVGVLILGFHGYLLQKYQSLKGDKSQFLKKYENLKLIFEDFKDTTLATQSFLWIHLVRTLISSLLFATLFEYPLLQILVLLISNIGMIIFILMKNPFKDVLSTCSQVFCEVVLLIASVCMLVMIIFDQAESYPIDAIKHLSRGIIILNMILLFGSVIFMVIGVLKSLWNIYQARKKPQQSIPSIKNTRIEKHNSNINQSNHWTRGDNFEARQNYSDVPGGYNTTTMNHLNTQGALNISEISYDFQGLSRENPNLIANLNTSSPNYQGESYQLGANESFIDETIMNNSNANVLRLRPRKLGKIKMPGGIEINPRSNGASPNIAAFQSPPLLFQNPRPMNMENNSVGEFESQLRSSEMQHEQKKRASKYEEFILERTRGRMKYHKSRTNTNM